MGINVRLDDQEHRRLTKHVADAGLSISEFVRRAIAEKIERDRGSQPRKTAYQGLMELGVDFDSGEEDRSARHREILVAEIDRKQRRAARRGK